MSFTLSGFSPAGYIPESYLPLGFLPVYYRERFDNAKELAIWSWASAVVGDTFTVIWDKPGEPRPDRPYITLNIKPSNKICNMVIEYSTTDTYIYNFKKKATLTVNVYADNAYIKTCEQLLDSLEIPTYQAILRQGGVAIWDSFQPLDLTEVIDTDFEGRASFDMIISYNVSRVISLKEIESVEFTGICGKTTLIERE